MNVEGIIKSRMGGVEPEALILAAKQAGIPLAAACAMIQQESGGKNIYGHDVGGALSTNKRSVTVCGKTWPAGSNIPVTPANAGIFLLMVGAGARSNGMGPAQITYAGELPDGRSGGYFRQMLERSLLPWRPHDNMLFGFEKLAESYKRTDSWARTFGHYNGGSTPNMTYGNQVNNLMTRWKDALP